MSQITINNRRYYPSYERLIIIEDHAETSKAHVACPKCHNTTFEISFGNYKCIANCKCGHSMTVYDG